MTNDVTLAAAAEASRETHVVHALVHYWRVLRYRQTTVSGCVIVALMLGGLYYSTAPRQYQAKASLLVIQSGGDVTNTSLTASDVRQGLMPTYEKLFTSSVVLEGAIKYLQPEHCTDFQLLAPDKWAAAMKSNTAALTVRNTNIIELTYRSKSPQASVAIVNAIVKAYLDFINRTQRGTAGKVIEVLTIEKNQLEQKLQGKEAEILQARKQFGDLGIRSGDKVVHPLVQRAIGLNETLIKSQQRRLELQSSLTAIQAAIRNGEDIQQHLLALEESLGREFFLNGLGFSQQDGQLQAELEKTLLQDRAEIRTLQEYYGPNHPKVMEVADRVRLTEKYLAEYHSRAEQRLSQVREKQLGPMLVQMVQQRVSEAWQHENALRVNFEQARADAVNLNGEMARLEILEHDLKRLRGLHDVLLNQISGVDLKQDHGDIRTAVISEPVLPKSPLWPSLTIVGLGAMVGGLLFGMALVYVMDILDDRFRSPEEMRMQLGVPVLAMVRQMEELHAFGLQGIKMHIDPNAVETEAFRTLRTTLALANEDTSRLVICSAEPGDGKTTVIANLAIAFVQAGKRTLLIDADLRRPGLSNLMGLKGQVGLSDLLTAKEDVSEVAPNMLRSTGLEGFDFIPAGTRRPNPAELLSGSRLAELLAWAEPNYDQILIDSPPALAASDASIIGRLIDGLVLVVQPKKNRRRMVVHAAESFAIGSINLLGVVVNRVSNEKNDTIYGYGAGYGYGYGYGYNDGYSNEEDAAASPAEPLETAEVSEAQPTLPLMPAQRPNSPASPPPLSPRRVA